MIAQRTSHCDNASELGAIVASLPPRVQASETTLDLFARRISDRCRDLPRGIAACLEFDPCSHIDVACWVSAQLAEAKALNGSTSFEIKNPEAYAWIIVRRRLANALRTAQRMVGNCEFQSINVLANHDAPDRRLNNKPIPSTRFQVASTSEFGDELVTLVLEVSPRAIFGQKKMRRATLIKCILRLGWAIQMQIGKESDVYRQFVDGLGSKLASVAGLTNADCTNLVSGLNHLEALWNHRADFQAASLKPPDREAWRLFIQLCGQSDWLGSSPYCSLSFNNSENESDDE